MVLDLWCIARRSLQVRQTIVKSAIYRLMWLLGRHYAMKIQSKKGMIHACRNQLTKIDHEKKALALLQHPFIVSMDYAFHTESLAIMVLGLATGGDLRDRLISFPECRMPVDQVRFYAAEIVLALSYLHSMHLIYRDLKPQNVLLHADGHVQLADLGGVMDECGAVLKHSDSQTRRLPLWDNSSRVEKRAETASPDNGKRKFSIFGTKG